MSIAGQNNAARLHLGEVQPDQHSRIDRQVTRGPAICNMIGWA
jgi:hypothetical protein